MIPGRDADLVAIVIQKRCERSLKTRLEGERTCAVAFCVGICIRILSLFNATVELKNYHRNVIIGTLRLIGHSDERAGFYLLAHETLKGNRRHEIAEKEESIHSNFSPNKPLYFIYIYGTRDFVFAFKAWRGQRDSTLVSY